MGIHPGHGSTGVLDRRLPARIPRTRVPRIRAVLLLVSYVCGTVQLMAFLSIDLWGALAIAGGSLHHPDAVKLVCGARVGCPLPRLAHKTRATGRDARIFDMCHRDWRLR